MKKLIALLLVMILFCACTPKPDDLTEDYTQKIGKLTGTPSEKFNGAQHEFAVELLKQNFESKNILISPLSVKLALAMVLNGAESETKEQMEAVLGLTADELNEEIYKYVSALPSTEKSSIHIANSIWFRDDEKLNVKDEFLQKNVDYYSAGIYKESFDSKTVKQINSWVKENTDGMIDEIIDDISSDTMMYLINALAFEAEWSSPYRESQVNDGVFTSISGEEQKVKMMSSSEYKYLENENATGFIKYYKGSDYAFVALLPKNDIKEYINSLDGKEIEALLDDVSSETVKCKMPKFSLDYSVILNDTLKNMGMEDAFEYTADFSKISDMPLYINTVIHKTHITVDEKGTKAGAVTAVKMENAAAPMDKPKEVILDRPFVYMIIDTANDLPIFIGALTDVK